MEKFATLLIPGMLAILLLRSLLIPMKTGFRVAIHSACGFLCLWILNAVSLFTGILFPINLVSVLVAGICGLPGIGILAILAVMGP